MKIKTLLRFMKLSNNLRLDLGIRGLLPDWKAMFSTKDLKGDLLAGVTVGCVAIPLSLAIALASGVAPAVGLTTAIVAGIVCALFGGTPLAVSGPAAAMAVLIASVVKSQGVAGLLIVGFGAGVLQMIAGIMGFGRFVRLIPIPVVEGFTAGIGAIIFLGQLPRALGFPHMPHAELFKLVLSPATFISDINPTIALLSVATVLVVKLSPRVISFIPGALLGVILPSIFLALTGVKVPEIGEIPRNLPLPQFPNLGSVSWGVIFKETLAVFFLASIETLLSSSVVDRLSKTKPHDSDQELIGQGLGNIAVSLVGGIPVTGVIARSAVNIRSGAKSRRSAIIHSLTLICSVFFLAPWIAQIPVAALAGVLIAIALTMLQPSTFVHLWKVSRGEAIVYATTFLVLVFVDLIAGIQAGFIAAALLGLLRASQLKFVLHKRDGNYPVRISLNGPMTFLTTSQFDKIRTLALKAEPKHGLVLDFSSLTQLDSSGSGFLIQLIEELRRQGLQTVLKSMRAECRKTLEDFDKDQLTPNLHATTESEIEKMLSLQFSGSPRNRLLHGVQVFHEQHRKRYSEIFQKLADGQSPHTLFITCSDSRIQPNLITATDPGELFVVRNVGNIIPACGRDSTPAEGAAVEYAVGILGVREIVLCGHYGCGAMASLFSGIDETKYPSVSQWLSDATNIRKNNPHIKTPDEATEKNVLIQLENLKTYPCVQEAMKSKGLQIRGWIKDLKKAELYEWDEKTVRFRPIREITS